MWTVGQTVERKLRFYISPAYGGRSVNLRFTLFVCLFVFFSKKIVNSERSECMLEWMKKNKVLNKQRSVE